MANLILKNALDLSDTASQSTIPKDNAKSSSREQGVQPNASRQRFKPQLSCTFCRTRKLKCDRNSPCNNCSKRDLSSSCTYIHNSREKTSKAQKVKDKPKDVQERIQHLEELVVALMSQVKDKTLVPGPTVPPDHQPSIFKGPKPSWPDDATVSESADSIGRISVEDELQNYVGGAHWAAILENIAGLKDSLGSEEWPQGTASGKNKHKGPVLLLGDNRKASRESVLACLPSKPVVDNLIERYFTAIDASFITHTPTFKKEYDEFWDDPNSKSFSWLGYLFAIICLSVNFELRTGDIPIPALSDMAVRDTEQRIRLYREKTVQCLVNSNYTEPGLYTVETLLLYYLSEHFQSKDALFGSWMLFGMIVRAGLRLGMHRDASHYPNISVFRGEMQRRIWAGILIVDIQTSCQVGLPRMVSEEMYDTKAPNNLLDEDLYESMVALPPVRSEDEGSPMSHVLSKYRLLIVFGKIFDASNSITPIQYDEVMRLEKMLLGTREGIPEVYRVGSIKSLDTGPIMLRVRKFSIEMSYLKARCFLHRKFLSEAESLRKHSYSVKACVDSSMLILQYQNYMTIETAMGHSLHAMKWITSSLMTYDFLLAATLLCLYLGQLMAAEEETVDTAFREFPIEWTKEDISHALLKSYQIWNNPEHSSEDTIKFSKVLKAMLNKVDHWSTANKTQTKVSKEITNEANSSNPPNYPASNMYSFPSSDFEENGSKFPTSNIEMIGDILNDPAGLDWNLWDTNFQGSNIYIDAAGSSLFASDLYFPFQAAGLETDMDGS
ncbi:hypothetical protein SBOR_1788 [Sclerotinia borealis F-4128]|uniref:Zn(2)-C6 fungal-type domain-containing protein n=1 Tax=Sclerotinia borealis (strain F-4128) TaxID=1432307 RepID=W9CT65_SCLBF|nr:hypothetical protein SBOR_1788 [Sclerotinia borealis F-4128]